jgi:hypothetical protein
MSVIEIVVISVLCGMFGLAMVAGVAFLIWLAIDLRKIQNKTQQAIEKNEQETKVIFDSAKSSFAAIRAETKAILEDHRKQTTVMLDESRIALTAAIRTINAEALTAAAVRCMEACQQLGKTISVFQRLILENTEQRTPNEYGPEEFAPERTEFGGPPSNFSVGLNAATDAEAEREAGALQESGSV